MRKKIKVASLPLRSRLVRSIRSFFHNKVFPHSLRIFWFFLIVIALVVGYLFFLKKESLVGFRDNFSRHLFNSLGFNAGSQSYTKINIFGNRYSDYEQIELIAREEIRKFGNQNGSFINSIKKRVEELPWIDEVVVSRSLPSILSITIKEYDPFAIWNDDDNKYVINKDGKIIKVDNIEDFYYLIMLNGKGANLNANSLFNVLTIDPEISKNVYSASWIGGRRWDIKFENGLLVKLPEANIGDAWNRLINIYNMSDSAVGLKVVDLRVSKKIYLEYTDQTTKELKSL